MRIILDHLGFAFFYVLTGSAIAGLLWWVVQVM